MQKIFLIFFTVMLAGVTMASPDTKEIGDKILPFVRITISESQFPARVLEQEGCKLSLASDEKTFAVNIERANCEIYSRGANLLVFEQKYKVHLGVSGKFSHFETERKIISG